MSKQLDLYLIALRGSKQVLFSPTDVLDACESESGDRVRQFISWFKLRPNRLAAWFGRVLAAGHAYYIRLEDKIDPVERVLKAMQGCERMTVYYSPSCNPAEARERFSSLLSRQRLKHIIWISLDSIVCAVAVAFSPILVPIPGPNIFFYYPFLRWLSHYRAIRGAVSGLRSSAIEFKSLPELGSLEENLQTPSLDSAGVQATAERLNIQGLLQFLERMV